MSQRRAKSKKRQRPAAGKATRPNPTNRDATGRLHLLLHTDVNSGAVSVGLRAPVFAESWQNEVALSAAGTAYAELYANRNQRGVVALAQQAMTATSQLAEGLLARAANGVVACKAGCDHCCYQSVGVTTPEAFAIVEYLLRTRSIEEISQLKVKLSEARERTRGLSSAERYSPDLPCPFLRAAACSIYEVRPLSCRGMNSLDAGECESKLRDPDARAAFLETGIGVKSFMEPIRAFHAVSAGIQLGLSELFGLDMRPLDLTAAILELLSHPELAEPWLAGESPLEAARGGDGSNSADVQELTGGMHPTP